MKNELHDRFDAARIEKNIFLAKKILFLYELREILRFKPVFLRF